MVYLLIYNYCHIILNWQLFKGKEWVHVEAPENDSKITQVSVGFQSVWAITNDSRVWYRKGIDHSVNEGTSWVKLNTFMFSVSVTPNDQVNLIIHK